MHANDNQFTVLSPLDMINHYTLVYEQVNHMKLMLY